MTIVNCKECTKKFDKLPNEILSTNGNFCTSSCAATYNNRGKQKNPPKILTCLNCSLSYIRKDYRSNKYCSIKCRDAFKENKIKNSKIKKIKTKLCPGCNKNNILYYSQTCRNCIVVNQDIKERTLADYHSKESVAEKHPSWLNAQIRQFNRVWNKELILLPCANCDYSKHVELAHIKPVSSFDKTATLGLVNHQSNVIQLCRNCHWEFDNGFLSIEDIKNKQLF